MGEPVFSLVYGADALLRIEVNLPTIRTLNYNIEDNIQSHCANPGLIEELLEDAKLRMMAFK